MKIVVSFAKILLIADKLTCQMGSVKKIHFDISERKVLLKVFDVLSVLFSLYIISAFFDFKYFTFSYTNFHWAIILAAYIVVFGLVFEMYHLQVASNQLKVTKSTILTVSTTVLVYLLTPVYTPVLPPSRLQILIFYGAVFGSLLLWRIFYVKYLATYRFAKNAILICDKEQLDELVSQLENADPHYKVVAFLNSDDSHAGSWSMNGIVNICSKNLNDFVRDNYVSEIVIASKKTESITVDLYSEMIGLLGNGIVVREYSQLYEEITHRVPVQYMSRDFYLHFPFSRSNQNHLYQTFIRFSEIIVSVLGITVGLFLLPFLFVGNLLANRGPLFYSQERVGKNGKTFRIYKYRTMVVDAEANGAVFACANDARVTPFGMFMRKSRLDEFPQFINILKGDMAIIGPRPERPVFVDEIVQGMPFYETRHVIKPGLTGWAQVNYAYGSTLKDSLLKLQYDLYYIKHRNIFLDISIMIKTVTTVLFYRGQ